jgi:spoIIIJ-associated protein
MDKKESKIVDKTITDLLKTLEIEGDFEIAQEDEGIDVMLNTEDSGLVIGFHGDTLESLQLVMSLCIAKELGRFVRVSIEVGDYKKNRTEWLKNLALTTREKVVRENQGIPLPELKSWERRIVHLLLQNDEEVTSESQGEGRERVLVISPKN